MFRILDRYVIKEIVGPFAISLLISTFALEIPTILKNGEDLLSRGVEFSVIARVLWFLLPSVLSLTIPISLLLGILIGLGRLSADREFVAMQACGISVMRLLRPIALVGVVATGATAYQSIFGLPAGNQGFREITYSEMRARDFERGVQPGVFFDKLVNPILYVQEVPLEGGWRGVFLADSSDPSKRVISFAKTGRILLDREQQLVSLELKDVTSYTTYVNKPDSVEDHSDAQMELHLDPKKVFPDAPPRGDREMPMGELRRLIADRQKNGDPALEERFTYQNRMSLPLACPVLALIGLGLGASNRRDGKLASFVLGFGVIFTHYILMFGFRALAKGGKFNAEWSAWMPDLIMGCVGLALLAWRTRSADRPFRLSVPAFWRRAFDPERSQDPAALAQRRRVVLVVRLPHLHLPRPRLLDLYIAREYWRVVMLAFLALLGIFYVSTLVDLVDKLFRNETTIRILVSYFFFETPRYAFYVLPMSVLVATLVTIAVMTKNNELIVMRACGISIYRAALPIVLFAGMVSGVLFLMQEHVLPAANREADRLNRLIRGQPPQQSPFSQRWVIARNGDLYHYDLLNLPEKKFLQLWIYHVAPHQGLRAITYAKEATLVGGPGAGDPLLMTWEARQGWRRELPGPDRYEPFETRKLAIEPPDYFASKPHDTDQMSYDEMLTRAELRTFIEQVRASGADVQSYLVALQRKVAFPFVAVIMTLLAIPFAAATGRRGALYGIGIGIVLSISYFITMAVFGALGKGGLLDPMMAAWAANVIFSAAALYSILTVRT